MENLEFWKMSGSGNDFILVDNRKGQVPPGRMGNLVRRVCRRRESVGADGVIFVETSDTHDFKWRFFNADGGEAEMCGNGGRCAARFAFLNGIAGDELTFDTLAGPVSAVVRGRHVNVRMPRPFGYEADVELPGPDAPVRCDFINTGVPHAVMRVEGLESFPVVQNGRWVRNHARFAPAGTNANYIAVMGRNSLSIRTYERGVEDETLACGTGSIAAALVSAVRGLVDSPVRVKTRGGEELTIRFKGDAGSFEEVWMEGSTSIVYKARLGEEAL